MKQVLAAEPTCKEPRDGPGLSRAELIAEAAEIAAQIQARIRYTREGDVTWEGPEGYGTEQSPLVVKRFGPDLYHGTVGVALFFAAAAKAQGSDDLRQLSLDTVAPLRRKLAWMAAHADPLPLRLGGFKGIGSFLYGLLTLGKLLGEPGLITEAHQATVLITPEQIARDRQMRVQTGSAGTILALLTLHRELPDPNAEGRRPLDLARDCARHLLASRISWEGRPRAWALSPGKPPVIGFGYGAAGICHALLRLYGETGERELREAVREGLLFLRGLYSPEHGNWRDPRALFEERHRLRGGSWTDWWYSGSPGDLEPLRPEEMASAGPSAGQLFHRTWCHGSSGILLGKLATLPLDDSVEVRQEIRAGLDGLCPGTEDSEGVDGEADDLCCGRMGHVEALLYAYGKLSDPRYLSAAQRLVSLARNRRRRTGRYDLTAARGTEVFAPSLLQGLAGIGYTCLRLAMTRELPCLLLLE